ncbi:DUF1684 domain-containing protein [Leifsonia sp. NPDC058194]|uniref:DUF1684 domain-containing protein n=1 Tax=Leifsonia sp. NPDC058194 TaxID=3346374 RepID=UPI0036DD9431
MSIATETDTTAFTAAWTAWHDAHETARADAHGFLAVTSLRWLAAEPERFDDVPGAWSTGEDGPVVLLGEGEELIVDGAPVTGRYAFGPIAERDQRTAAFGDAVVEVARRGGSDIVRPRHPDAALRTSYAGTPTYAPDERWAVAGRFEPFDEPREVTVGSAAEGLEHVYAAPGEVVFEHDGAEHRLIAFDGRTPGSLLVLFLDATSGVTTYAANRSLGVAAPAADGSVVLDFTRAVNLPCAYTDFATCPLPPAGNRLPFAVTAGERIPVERGGERADA